MKLKNLAMLIIFLTSQFILAVTYAQNYQEYDPTEQTLNSDLVIIGTVKNIKETPAKTSEIFHSMIIIEIENTLKGNNNFKEIKIRLESGPVTDDIHGGDRIISSIEPKFNIGERVFLFLNRNKNNSYLNSEFVKKNFKSFDGKKNISELSEDTFWVSNMQVFKSENGIVNYFGRSIKDSDFIDIIIK